MVQSPKFLVIPLVATLPNHWFGCSGNTKNSSYVHWVRFFFFLPSGSKFCTLRFFFLKEYFRLTCLHAENKQSQVIISVQCMKVQVQNRDEQNEETWCSEVPDCRILLQKDNPFSRPPYYPVTLTLLLSFYWQAHPKPSIYQHISAMQEKS